MIALYGDPLFFRRNFGGRDLTAYNLPMEKSVHGAWSRGQLPAWQAEVSGGRPLLPNPNAGALYPIRALLAPLPFPMVVRLYPVLHWIAAGIGMVVLLRSLGRSRPATWLGAVTYAFSGVAVAEVFYPHIQPGMTLLPWIVWAAAHRAGSSASRLLVLSSLLALDMLAADVFTIAMAIGCAVLWIGLEDGPVDRLHAMGRLGIAVVLASLAALPQIVATALWVPHTNRAVLGMKLSDVIFFSIHPWRLLELVIPYPFGPSWSLETREMWGTSVFRGRAMGIFPTLYAGSFAPIAVLFAWRSRDPGARFAKALLAAALFVSVVPSLLPASWGSWPAPIPLRNPEKFAVSVGLALSLISAIAFDSYRSNPRRLGLGIAVGGLLATAALLCARFPHSAGGRAVSAVGADPALADTAARHLPAALAEAGLLWMLMIVALDRLGGARRVAPPAAACLLALLPILGAHRIARTFREDRVFAPTAFARYAARHDPEGAYRTLDESLYRRGSKLEEAQFGGALSDVEFSRRTWYHPTPALFSRGMVFNEDFDSGDLSRIESLRKVSGRAAGYRDSDALFGSVALRWGIRYKDQEAVAGFVPIGGDALQTWDEHCRPYPDVRLLEQWREVVGPVAAFQSIAGLRDGEVVVETEAARRGAARKGTVRVVRRSAERLVLDVDAPEASWIFVLRAYWPYRSILLDGKPVEPYPAQLAFSAVPIPAGHHRLIWEERVPGLRVSGWGPGLFAIIAAGLVVAHTRWGMR